MRRNGNKINPHCDNKASKGGMMKKFLFLLVALLFASCTNKSPMAVEELEDIFEPDSITNIMYTLTVENFETMPCSCIGIIVDGEAVCFLSEGNPKGIIILPFYQSEHTKLEAFFWNPYIPPLIHTINTIGISTVHWKVSSDRLTFTAVELD